LDSRLQLYIEGPIEVSNDDTILQILITLDYAMELYTLTHRLPACSHVPLPVSMSS
jgi:hypothetical protein